MSCFKINNILFIEIIELNKNVYFLPDIYILQYNFRTQRVCHWLENNLVTLNSSWRKLHISNKFYTRSSHHMLTVLFVIFFYSTFSTPVVFNQVIYFCDTVLMFFPCLCRSNFVSFWWFFLIKGRCFHPSRKWWF